MSGNTPSGARIDVYRYPVRGLEWMGDLKPYHAFVVITDPATGARWVARGGPGWSRASGDVVSETTPWAQSREREVLKDNLNAAERVQSVRTNLPAAEAARRASEVTGAANKGRNTYNAGFVNSNSIASSVFTTLTGRPMRAGITPGNGMRLSSDPFETDMRRMQAAALADGGQPIDASELNAVLGRMHGGRGR